MHRGYRWFDLGGTDPRHGYTHFKEGMHGTSYRLVDEWLSY